MVSPRSVNVTIPIEFIVWSRTADVQPQYALGWRKR